MGEPAFRGAGQKEGLEAWRIENLLPVKLPAVNGKFHMGDSYIVLYTYRKGTALAWNIHFWLGKDTSQDESGIAAYKSVELDDSLGGAPVQYREVMESESDLFLSYFKSTGGIEYLPGGVDSGFVHVEKDVYETRLLHLKGKRTVRVRSVAVSNASLNNGDVFILDLGLSIYIYNGPLANKYEKVKGLEVANNIRNDERGGRANLVYLDDDPNNSDFWGTLGGQIEVTNPGEDDAAVEEQQVQKRLFKLEASGFDPSKEIPLTAGRLQKGALQSDGLYLVVGSSSKLYLWIGRTVAPDLKREAMNCAMAYIKFASLPASTAIQRVSEGVETSTFKGEFYMWDPPMQFKLGGVGNSRQVVQTEVDYAALVARKAAEDVPVDDGSGKLDIWRVEDFALAAVPKAKYGQFYGGDSYVMQYSYEKNGRPMYILYFWQGRGSSADEKGASALLTKDLDDKLGGKATQIRVVQGKEPSHFRSLFKGSMVVHEGGRASSFNNSKETDSYDTDGVALFHVKGTTTLNTHAVQVEEKATSLNSSDCFVLITPSTAYAWLGRGSNADEKSVAEGVATRLANDYLDVTGRTVSVIHEGTEPEEFWAPLGGKTEYMEFPAGEDMPKDPRLFHASTATGCFKVDEIDNFEQDDLIDDDVMILDTYTQVFIWIGSQSTEEEKVKSREAAERFIAAADDGRNPSEVPIISIYSGDEPLMFTSHFHGWDPSLAEKNKFVDPYAAKMAASKSSEGGTPAVDYRSNLRKSVIMSPPPVPPAPPSDEEPPRAYALPGRRTSLGAGESASPAPPPGRRTSLGAGESACQAPSAVSPVPAERRPSTKFPVPVAPAVLTAEQVKGANTAATASSNSAYLDPSATGPISYETLKGAFPPSVNPANKEEYLSDAEFSKLFGVDKATFKAQPKWKKDTKKKELGLF